jgi:hypothetical protein
MTLVLLEGAISALYSYLHDNIADKLDEIDVRYSDGVILEDIKEWYQGEMPFNFPEVPSISLVGNGWRPGSQQAEFLEVNNLVDIIVMVGDAEPSVRFKRLCRYALAIIELLMAGEDTYGYTQYFDGDIALSEVLSTPQFLQAIRIPVRLFKIES